MTVDDKVYYISIVVILVLGGAALEMFYKPAYDIVYSLDSVHSREALDKVNPNDTTNWQDIMIVTAIFMFNVLICIILPLYVPHNPIFIIAIFFFSFIYVFIVALVSNILVEVVNDMGSGMVMTITIIENWVSIEVVFLLVMTTIMFFKWRSISGQQQYYQ